MACALRVEYPGAFYHVINGGNAGVDLGKYFGNICGAAVTIRYRNISEQISQNRRLKGRISWVKKKIGCLLASIKWFILLTITAICHLLDFSYKVCHCCSFLSAVHVAATRSETM
jgi:hypothetical protein